MLDDGVIERCPFTSTDLKAARALFGPCLACIEGKMRAAPSPASTTAPALTVGENIAMDTFKYPVTTIGGNNWGFLAVDEASGYLVLVSSPSKNVAAVEKAQAAIIAHFNQFQHRVQKVTTDHEANFKAAKDKLSSVGVKFNDTVPHMHQKLIERYKQVLEDTRATILAELPYTPPAKLEGVLYAHCVALRNGIVCSKSAPYSPIQLVEGRRAPMHEYSWGQVGYFQEAKGERKAEHGIIVGFSGDTRYKYHVYLWSKDSIFTRGKFHPLQDIPDHWDWPRRIVQRTRGVKTREQRIVNGTIPVNMNIQTGLPVTASASSPVASDQAPASATDLVESASPVSASPSAAPPGSRATAMGESSQTLRRRPSLQMVLVQLIQFLLR